MTDRITTAKISDLLNIFDPKAQEPDDVGGARILYTFTEDEQAVRERVGANFILEVLEPQVSFFVSVPVEGNVDAGTLVLSEPLEGVDDRYQLTKTQLEKLIFDVSVALDYDEDMVNKLLEE